MQKDENIRWRYMSEENVEQERSFRQQRRRFYQDIGAYLKKHRQNRHCSQSRLAAQIGCSLHNLYAFEAGFQNISLWYFVRACRVLRLDFRFDQSFRLEPEERQWVEALRRNDYVYVLNWLAAEWGGEEIRRSHIIPMLDGDERSADAFSYISADEI